MSNAPRPTMSREIEREAALQIAGKLLEIVPDPSREGESREALLERIVVSLTDLRGHIRQGSIHVARLLGEQIGFRPNELVQELAEYLPTEEANALARHIREWVSAQRIAPPFEKGCRARLSPAGMRTHGLKGDGEGVAVRRPDLDRSAYARFVLDADREEYVNSHGLRGHRIVRWEDLLDIRPIDDPLDTYVAAAARMRDREVARRTVEAPEDKASSDGGRRILTAAHDARRQAMLDLVDEARDAMVGQDEEQARRTIKALHEGLRALWTIERAEGPIRLSLPKDAQPSP